MAVKGFEIEGMDELNKALADLVPEVNEAAMAGMFAGGLIIQGESQKGVPVEYGNLRASAYTAMPGNLTRVDESGLDASENRPDPTIPAGSKFVEVGHTANYAIYVHENMEQTLKGEPRPSGLGTYWNPGGPKFLEKAVNENAREVLDQVAVRIGKVIE